MLPKWIIILSVALAILAHSDSSSARFLIWDADSNANSGPVIRTALYGASYEGDYTTDINPYIDSLSNYCAIFICLGVHDSRFVLTPGPIVDSLVGYLNAGGKIYMEGGDTWAYDTTTALHPYFKIIGDWDGISDVVTILGQMGTFTEGMTFTYSPSADNKYMDRILPDTLSTAFVIFENERPSYADGEAYNRGAKYQHLDCLLASPIYVNGVAYDDGVGLYKTIGVSFEFGGLEDRASPSSKTDLADSIMGFFGCPPAIYNLNVGLTSITKPGSWALPSIPLTPQAKVKNLGTDTVTFNVTCVVDSGMSTIYTDTQPVTDLVSDSIRQVNFASWTPGEVGSCYHIIFYTQLTGDQMTANDTLEIATCIFDTTWEIASQYTSNPPTIDGFMAPGEWTDATQRDVSNIFDKDYSLGSPASVYFYVKNDEDSVYMAIDAFADTTDAGGDEFWTYLDDDNDGAWPVWPLPTEGELITTVAYPRFSAMNRDSCNWWPPCSLPRGTYRSMASGHMQYEIGLCLCPVPDTFCGGFAGIQSSACDTVGLWLAVVDHSASDSMWIAWWPTLSWTPAGWVCEPGKMGDLILACPPDICDGAVLSLDAPPDTVCRDSIYQVRSTIRNVGNVTLDTIYATCAIRAGPDTLYLGFGMVYGLAPDSASQIMFIPWLVPPTAPLPCTMTVTITSAEDTLFSNNSLSKALYDCEVGIEEKLRGARLPKVFELSQNRPNPFLLSTEIRYALPKECEVVIRIYDVTGREVRTLADKQLDPGFYRISWDGRDARNKPTGSGVYFLRMDAGEFRYVRKMVMLN